MAIRDEAPDVARYQDELNKVDRELTDLVRGVVIRVGLPVRYEGKSRAGELWLKRQSIEKTYAESVKRHSISLDAKNRLLRALEECISDPLNVNIICHEMLYPLKFGQFVDEWFEIVHHKDMGVLDRFTSVNIYHRELFVEVSKKFGNNPNFTICDPDSQAAYVEKNNQILDKYEIREDMLPWASEILHLADRALDEMDSRFTLSDFVEWDCSDDPLTHGLDAVFGEAKLFESATFGSRIYDERFERIDWPPVWKTTSGTFVSPYWMYLDVCSSIFGAFSEHAQYLSHIGEGIDAAVLSYDADADPDDGARIRNTPQRILRAGEAMAKLRIKFELEEYAIKGMKAQSAAKARGEKGSRKSMQALVARRSALMDAIEFLVERNPILKEMKPNMIADKAAEHICKTDPAFRRQGAGQAREYLGAIRDGEAGSGMQERYFRLFPRRRLSGLGKKPKASERH